MAKATPRSKCLKAIQLLARVSAADDNGYCTCVSCGERGHYKEFDGGHFIAKGTSSRWALELINVAPQCKGCNGFGMKYGIAAQQYMLWMIDKYGRKPETSEILDLAKTAGLSDLKSHHIYATTAYKNNLIAKRGTKNTDVSGSIVDINDVGISAEDKRKIELDQIDYMIDHPDEIVCV